MKRIEIYSKLSEWCKMITQKYEWLTVKFEYSDGRGTYLVSFYPSSKTESCEQFNIDAMAFEDEMNDIYGDIAPLFCDEESCFKLSNEAEVFGPSINIFENNTNNIDSYSWSSEFFYTSSETNDYSDYFLAA